MLAIGVDIGGTKVAAGVVDDGVGIIANDGVRRPGTRRTHRAGDLRGGAELGADTVGAVGMGAAGWISVDRATVLFSPHLAWRNEPLRDALAERIGTRR